ncbi:MAG TPA: oxygenase MpaB family protein [Acidimicrobiales bacterium]|nr:oxygenase MpaB family protein [Acidimicrobiales bacterium]
MKLDPMGPIRGMVASTMRSKFGKPLVSFDDSPGDPGLFGPDSVTWRVHSDTPAMLIGGVSSLLLQTLHPGAMAGVADFSVYEEDPRGRLQRTGTFVGGTIFGSTATAEKLIDTVKKVHESVQGIRPDGLPYAASDPDLLRWVHVAEHAQFLRSNQLFGVRPLRAPDVDRYFAEVAEIARRLGATRVPTDAAGVEAYLTAVRPELAFGDQAARGLQFLLAPNIGGVVDQAAYAPLIRAAISILPDWASRMLGVWQPWPELVATRGAVWGLCRAMRMVMPRNEAFSRSVRRARALPEPAAA